MSSFNNYKKVLLGLLSRYCPAVFYQLCPADVGFPRTVFELKQLNVFDVPYKKYLLTVNCFDKGQAEALDDSLDKLIREADTAIFKTKDFYYQLFYQNDRQPITEADKQIKRIMLTFEVRIFKN